MTTTVNIGEERKSAGAPKKAEFDPRTARQADGSPCRVDADGRLLDAPAVPDGMKLPGAEHWSKETEERSNASGTFTVNLGKEAQSVFAIAQMEAAIAKKQETLQEMRDDLEELRNPSPERAAAKVVNRALTKARNIFSDLVASGIMSEEEARLKLEQVEKGFEIDL